MENAAEQKSNPEDKIANMPHIAFWIKAIVGLFNVRKSLQDFVCNELDKQFEKMNNFPCRNCEMDALCAKCCKTLFGKTCRPPPKICDSWDIARAAMGVKLPDICSSADSTDVAGYLKTLQFCDFIKKSGEQKQHIKKVIRIRNKLAHSPTFTLEKREVELLLSKMVKLVKSFPNFDQDAVNTLHNLLTGSYGIKECLSGFEDAKTEVFEIVKESSVLTLASKIKEIPELTAENKKQFSILLQKIYATMDIKIIKDAFENKSQQEDYGSSVDKPYYNFDDDEEKESEEDSGSSVDKQYYTCGEDEERESEVDLKGAPIRRLQDTINEGCQGGVSVHSPVPYQQSRETSKPPIIMESAAEQKSTPENKPHITFWIKAIVGLFNVRKSLQCFVCNELHKQFEKMNNFPCRNCEMNDLCVKCCKTLFGKICKPPPKICNSWDIARAAMGIKLPDICSSADSTDVAGYLNALKFCDFIKKSNLQKQHIEKVICIRNQLAHSPTFTLEKREMEHILNKMVALIKSFPNFDQDALNTLDNLLTGLYGIKECLSGFEDAKTEIFEIVKESNVLTLASKLKEIPELTAENKKQFSILLHEIFETSDVKKIKDAFENRSQQGTQNTNVTVCGPRTEMVTSLKNVFKCTDVNTKYLYDGAYLPDGRLVVIDWDRDKLLLFDDSVTLQAQYDVESDPHGVCVSADGSLTYVVHYDGTLMKYRLQGGLKKVSRVKVQRGTIGVGVSGDTIIAGHEDNITLYNMEGKKLSSISKKESPTCICVSHDGSRFYHRDCHEIVCRSVSDLSEVFRYSHPELRKPFGIACDRHGNILVAGHWSANIIMIDKDGTHGRVLVDKLHGIRRPTGVCCHPQRDEFVVLSRNVMPYGENDNTMEVYEMK